MKLWTFRIFITVSATVGLPVIIALILWHELRSALRSTWLELRLEWSSFITMWRAGPPSSRRRQA